MSAFAIVLGDMAMGFGATESDAWTDAHAHCLLGGIPGGILGEARAMPCSDEAARIGDGSPSAIRLVDGVIYSTEDDIVARIRPPPPGRGGEMSVIAIVIGHRVVAYGADVGAAWDAAYAACRRGAVPVSTLDAARVEVVSEAVARRGDVSPAAIRVVDGVIRYPEEV